MGLGLLAGLIGLAVGIVVGALGAGGGILAVPILVYLLGQPPHVATASALVIVGLSAVSGLVQHAREGNVAWREGALFAVAAIVGAVVGSRLSFLVSGTALMLLLGSLLAVVGVVMARKGLSTRRSERAVERAADAMAEGEPPPGAHAADLTGARPRISWLRLLLAASLTGLLTGFFGVGGGFIVVPMLVLVLGLSMRRAAATSLLVMVITTAVSLLARVGTPVQVDWAVTLLFAAGSMVGAAGGGILSRRARGSTLTLCFAVLLFAVAVTTLGESVWGLVR